MPAGKRIYPPVWADKFLQWYCRQDLLEEIQGDAYELFYRKVDNNQPRKARWNFIWNVIRFFKPSNIRKSNYSNNTAMVKNYFKLGFRGILKNKLTASINIIGLSVSIGIAITTFMFVDFYINIDKFHENLDRVVYVQADINKSTGSYRYGATPAPLAGIIKDQDPSVDKVVRIKDESGIIRYKGEVHYERFRFADPAFLEVFTFPLAYGSKSSEGEASKIIISKDVAERYFDTDVALGEMITVIINEERREFEIGGVAEKFPENSSFAFDVLIPFENYAEWIAPINDDWTENVQATFVLLREAGAVNSLIKTLGGTIASQNQANPDNKIVKYHLEPLVTASRNGYKVNNDILLSNHPAGVYGGAITAALLLILTCINYTNIAVSAATSRLKEIALRKVIGGRRRELILQFLIENFILCVIAVAIGIALTEFLLLPGFNSAVPITFPFVLAPRFWIFILILLLSTCVISGAYPAFYISKFQPVEIFRSQEKFGKSIFSKVMLTFQFAIAFYLIISAFIFRQTEEYQKNIDWGYANEQKLVLPVDSHEQYRKLADAMELNPDIEGIAGAKNHFGKTTQRKTISHNLEQYEVRLMEGGANYLEFMGVNLLEGSFFDKNKESDFNESIVINETMMTTLGWDSWQGKTLNFDSSVFHVVGLVEDFHFHSFYTKIYPAMFRPVKETELRYLVAQIGTGNISSTDEYARKVWKENIPDLPYAGFYQDSVFDYFFTETKANAGIMKFLGLIAIILSCMGLYGLISFNVTKRMKELSVRKILGANSWSIFKQINKGFVFVLIIAICLAGPLTYILMGGLIDSIYEYYEPIGFAPFGLAFIALFVTVGITVSTKIFKVFKSNPVDALKDE